MGLRLWARPPCPCRAISLIVKLPWWRDLVAAPTRFRLGTRGNHIRMDSSELRRPHPLKEELVGGRAGLLPNRRPEPNRDSRAPSLRAVRPALERNPVSRRSSGWTLKALLATFDLVVLTLAMFVAAELRLALPGGSEVAIRAEGHVALFSLPIWTFLLVRNRLYVARHVTSMREEWRRLGSTVIAGCLGLAATTFLVHDNVPRGWILAVAPLAFALLVGERGLVRLLFARARERGLGVRDVVIIGANDEGRALADSLSARPSLGYRVLGFVDNDRGDTAAGKLLGSCEHILQVLDLSGANGVIIATTALESEEINRLARLLVKNGIHVELSSALRDVAHARLSIRPLGPFPVMSIEPVVLGGWRAAAKRTLDVVVAALILALAAPLLLLIAILVKLDSHGPVLFRQTRVGRHGCSFEVLKIRTMVADAELRLSSLLPANEASGPLFKLRNDPRVTRLGRFLRSWSLDEIPQLLNVLKGDMSLVGPRPALPREVSEWSPELHERLQVRPGITGMWQVKGRGGANFDDYLRLDLFYVENWSLLVDLSILVRTIPAVLKRTGAW